MMPLVLALMWASSAYAIVTPDSAEMVNLNKLLVAAQAAQTEFEKAQKKVDEGTSTVSELRQQRDVRDKAWALLVDRMLLAYEMAIPGRDGMARLPSERLVMGRNKGKTAQWVVQFGEMPTDAIIEAGRNISQQEIIEREKREANAITTFEGTTVIWKSDYRSPAELARTLFHERRHFYQLSEPRFADGNAADMEVDAYKPVVKEIENFGFGPDELKENREVMSKRVMKYAALSRLEAVKKGAGRVRSWVGRKLGAWEQDLTTWYDESTVSGVMLRQTDVDRFRAETLALRESIAAERSARSEVGSVNDDSGPRPDDGDGDSGRLAGPLGGGRASVPARVLPAPVPAQALPSPAVAAVEPYNPAGVLNRWAFMGCSDPASVSKGEFERELPRLVGRTVPTAKADDMALTGCQRAMFIRLAVTTQEDGMRDLSYERFLDLIGEVRASVGGVEVVPEREGRAIPDRPRCRSMGAWCE